MLARRTWTDKVNCNRVDHFLIERLGSDEGNYGHLIILIDE